MEEEDEAPQDKAASDPTPHRAPKPKNQEIKISEQALLAHKKRKDAADKARGAGLEPIMDVLPHMDGTMSHPPSARRPRRGRFEYLTPRGGQQPAAPVVVQHDQYDMHGRRNGGRGVKAYNKPVEALNGPGQWRDDMAAKLKGMEEAVKEVGAGKRGGNKYVDKGLPGIKEHRKALVPIHPNKGFEAPWGGQGGKKRVNDGQRNARVGQGGAVVRPITCQS